MWEKTKSFGQRHSNFIWVLVIVIVVLVLNNSGSITSSQKAGNYYAMDSAAPEAGYGLANPSDRYTTPTQDDYSEPGTVGGQDSKIKKTGYLNLEVEKEAYEQTKNKVDDLLTKHKGFYVNKNESNHAYNQLDYRTYNITIKFPKDSFENALEELKALGEVMSFNIDASDLTAQYYDIVGYKDSAEKVRDRIQALLAQTQNINDIITIESKLSDLQRQIDGYQQQLANMDRQTEYSQVTLNITEKTGYTESFYQMTKLRDLFKNAVDSIDRVFVNFSKLFGYLLLALVIWGIVKLVKKIKQRKNKQPVS